jgi:hypothetical protein
MTLPSHSTSTTASLVLESMRPNTNYTINVVAETEAGEGPYTVPMFCQTEQSGKHLA